MKLLLYFLLFTVNIIAYDKTIAYVNSSVLTKLDGYLEGKVIYTNFNTKNGSAYIRLLQCTKREQADYISANVGSRIYTTKCYKRYKDDFFSSINEKSINKYVKQIDVYLTNEYNKIIQKKLQQLNIRNQNNYYVQSLGYTINSVGYKREFNNYMYQLESNWRDIIAVMTDYDKSFGYLDNVWLLANLALGEKPTRERCVEDKNKLLQDSFSTASLLLKNLNENIKEKFREDISMGLNGIYE